MGKMKQKTKPAIPFQLAIPRPQLEPRISEPPSPKYKERYFSYGVCVEDNQFDLVSVRPLLIHAAPLVAKKSCESVPVVKKTREKMYV